MAEEVRNVTPVNTDTDSDDVVQALEEAILPEGLTTQVMANPVLNTSQNNDVRRESETHEDSEPLSRIIRENREKQLAREELDKVNTLIRETQAKLKKEEEKSAELEKDLLKKKKLNDNLKNLFVPYAKIAANFMILAIPFLTVFLPFAAFAVLAYFLSGALAKYQGSVEKSYISTSTKINNCTANLRVYKSDLKSLNQEKDELQTKINAPESDSSKIDRMQRQIDTLINLNRNGMNSPFAPRPAMATAGVSPTMQPAGADMGMELPPPPPAGKK